MIYVLVSIVEREIMYETFVSKNLAMEQMRKELIEQVNKNNALYTDDMVYFGMDDGEIGLNDNSAYSNLDDNQNWDWFIIEVSLIDALGLTNQQGVWLRELIDDERIQQLGMAKYAHLAALASENNELATMHEMNADTHRDYAQKLEKFWEGTV